MMDAHLPKRCWLCLALFAASCATTPTSTGVVAEPPVPAVGTWRNVTRLLDFPPGEVTVTLREDGTGILVTPLGPDPEWDVELAAKYWIFDEFTWTRQRLDGRADVLSLRGEGTVEPTAMQFVVSFSDGSRARVQPVAAGEPPDVEPRSPDGDASTWVFRRD